MPTPSRWMIKASMLYMLIGFVIGAMILISKVYPEYSSVWNLLTVHIEVGIFGWIIQLTMGTAYWILPRFLKTKSRGNPKLALAMVGMLNLGILINVASYVSILHSSAIILGRVLELGAVALFIVLHWNRAVSYNT